MARSEPPRTVRVEVELELPSPGAVPAITPLSWDFSAYRCALSGGVEQRQPEQGRNRGVWSQALTGGEAVANGPLPDEGPARLGPVTLPPGKLITGWHGSDHHVAWATVDPVPDSGQVWAALSELHPQTGLVPIVLDGLLGGLPHDGLPEDALRPWDSGEFIPPEDPRGADSVDVGAVLHDMWRSWMPLPDEDDLELVEMRAPFTREWPGLAPREHTLLTAAQRRHALDVVLPRVRQSATTVARIGLVAADRPAYVLAVIGWERLYGRGEDSLLPFTAVLRSWEDRFGARLIDVGFEDLRFWWSARHAPWRPLSASPLSRSSSPTTASTGPRISPT